MGTSFCDFCIRKTDGMSAEQIRASILDCMTQRGYTVAQNAGDAEVTVAIVSAAEGVESDWIKVCSDAIEYFGKEAVDAYVLPVAEALRTAVMTVAVFDSDAIALQLLHPAAGVDAFAKAGLTRELGLTRRNKLSAWEDYVTDTALFKAALGKERVFAEELLEDLVGLMRLPLSVSGTDWAALSQCGDLPCRAEYLYFKCPASEKRRLPELTWHCPGLLPQTIGAPQCFSFLNKGGASRGVRVCFTGSYVEGDEIVFEHIRLTYQDKNRCLIEIPLTLEKVELTNGETAFWADAPDLPLPEGPREDLPPRKYQEECFRRCISLRYTPQGNPRKVLDIEMTVIPCETPERGIRFCAWKLYGSKEAYIEEHSGDIPGSAQTFPKLRREDYD